LLLIRDMDRAVQGIPQTGGPPLIAPHHEGITATSDRTKILIVEDDAATREGLERILESDHTIVRGAGSLSEGRRALEGFNPDICLTDLRLPDGSGIEFIRSARSDTTHRDVIVLTGNASIDTAIEAMKAGAFDYLVKPLEARQINIVLRRLSEKRDIQKQLEEKEERFRALIERSSDAIALLDREGRIQYASSSTERVLGYDAEGFVGRHWFDLLHPDDGAAARNLFSVVLSEGGKIATGQHRMLHSGSSWRWMEAVFSNLLEESSVGAVVVNYRDITDRKRAVDELEYRAFHDALTGLPNRALFLDRLGQAVSRAKREDGRVAVMFIDLDNLKPINDTLGHAAGDEVIRRASERIRRCVREADTLARVGGDEFTLLLPDVSVLEDAETVAEKARASVAQSFLIGGREVSISTSIGIAVYPRDGGDAETLMQRADEALYRAKETGKNRFLFASPPR